MILIGSRALALRQPSTLTRKPLDFDWVCTQEEFDQWMEKNQHKVNPIKVYKEECRQGVHKMIVEGSTNCEFEIIDSEKSSGILQKLVENNPESLETPFGWVPSFDLLFTIKQSHRYLRNSPHFWKTLTDWHIMRRLGAKVRPEYRDFLNVREAETYWYKHPKLNVSKDDFFQDNGIQYEVEHDDIHVSVKLFDKPAYCYYLKDGAQVECDKEKFFSVSQDIRLAGVVEEAAVLAIERSLIPHPGVWTPEYAWKFALAKVCSSITSGWFRQFAYENAPAVLKLYPSGYWEKFQQDRAEGRVRPFSGKRY
jgi:hypothetical protein